MGGRSSHWQGPGEGEGRLEASLGTWLGLEERGQGHPLERPPTTDLGLTSGRTLGPPTPAACTVRGGHAPRVPQRAGWGPLLQGLVLWPWDLVLEARPPPTLLPGEQGRESKQSTGPSIPRRGWGWGTARQQLTLRSREKWRLGRAWELTEDPTQGGEERVGRGQHSADRQAQLNSHTTIGWAGSPQEPPKGPHHQAGGG